MPISVLNPKEIEAADALVHLYGKLAELDLVGRFRVYNRWMMLKLIRPGDPKKWEEEVKRVSGPTRG